MQHACDSWCATFSSTAITNINTIYERDFPTDEECQDPATQQLEDLEFLYGETHSKVRTNHVLNYQ